MTALHLVAALAAATAGGLLAERLGVPGGVIMGAMVGAAAVTLVTGVSVRIPGPVGTGAFVVIGAAIGVQLTRGTIGLLGPIIVPAVLSGGLIILAGVAIAYLLRILGMAPPGDILATSPGALSALSALAVEQGTGAVEVVVFHLIRVVMVLLSLPLLVYLLRTAP